MKRKISLVLAAIVLVALLAAPAAARGDTGSIKTIASGDGIFVYETGLNLNAFTISGLGTPATLTSLVKWDSPVDQNELNRIEVGIPASFDVLFSAVNGQYGTYYPARGAVVDINKSVLIYMPEATLGVVLNASHVDSLDGKSVTRDTPIAFKIGAAKVASYYKEGGVAVGQLDIEITTPGGAKIREFQNIPLSLLNVTGAEFYTDTGPNQSGRGAISLTGAEAGTYSALLKWNVSTFTNQAPNSAAVTFTVLSKPLTITTNKETVVRGNSFVVTITGEAKKIYFFYVKDVGVAVEKYPLVTPAQTGVYNITEVAQRAIVRPALPWPGMTDYINGTDKYPTGGNLSTAADGTRTVGFTTSQTTSDKKFTLKVVDPADSTKYDTVDVTVEKGAVTVTYEGSGTYYLGETIKISGTNTDSEKIYLFLIGPNLFSEGVKLDDVSVDVVDNTAAKFKEVSVNTDDSWSFKWDTSSLGKTIDAGTYTIYAAAEPRWKSKLSETQYQSASIVVKKPFVTAAASTNTLAKGDKLYIRGTAEGKPANVYVWIFGKNYRSCQNSASVKSDASYEYKLDRGDTANLYAGQYFMVVQHPMMNGIADIIGDTSGKLCTKFTPNPSLKTTSNLPAVTISSLQAPDAATALIDTLNSANIDDTYFKLSAMIEEGWIRIDTVGDKYVGDTFTVTGTTNLAEGDEILMTVVSSSFKPTEKTQSGEFSGKSGTVIVAKGDTYNTFSFDVDASTFKADEYLVKAECIQPDVTATTTFNVIEGKPTTVATTAGQTPVQTTAVQTTAVQTPVQTTAKPQPGFGAVIALIGLGAVAVLVLRRH